jgi:alpha-2-macroglobulin
MCASRALSRRETIMIRLRLLPFCLLVCLATGAVAAAQTRPPTGPALTVVSVGPEGEIAALEEAREIRIAFSEPMLPLGVIPRRVQPAFVKISPALPGTYRWSGTTILIFTPDPKRPLPFATTFQITIDRSATAASGRTLARSATFRFTTPTVKLLSADWYRRGGRYDGALVVALRFNQRVSAADVLAHLHASFAGHEWSLPDLDGLRSRLAASDPQSLRRFDTKVAATRAVAAATSPVRMAAARDWDKKTFPPKPDLVVVESIDPIPSESWIRLELDARVPSPAGPATPGRVQEHTVKVEQALFVDRMECATQCNPDNANVIWFRSPVKVPDFSRATSVRDVTGGREVALAKPHPPREKDEYGNTRDIETTLSLEDAGFDPPAPAHTYAISVDAGLQSADGQTLGYTWLGRLENWHRPAFTSFGDGHGVWETGGGTALPFFARNYRSATEWARAIAPRDLMPTIKQLADKHFTDPPSGPGRARQLGVWPDRIQSHGLDIASALGPAKTGLVWAAITPGTPIPQTKTYGGATSRSTRSTIVQVTNLGISVKDSPQNTLIFVTRLDTGAPVPNAAVSIVRLDNSVFWRGQTGADGIAIAADTPLRDADYYGRLAFLVTAEKDGDFAYVGSDWDEGIEPWQFDAGYNLNEAAPMLRGSVFTDRGVYRLGEEIHFKAVLRQNTPRGIRLLPSGATVVVSVRDSENREIDTRKVKLNAWSSADWAMTLPGDGALGNYSVRAILEADVPKPKPAEQRQPGAEPGWQDDDYVPYHKLVRASFLVAAYRRPDFRVDVALRGDSPVSGVALKGGITARYLFGAAMGARPVKWAFTREVSYTVPKAVREKYPEERWEFIGDVEYDPARAGTNVIQGKETTLTRSGSLAIELPTSDSRGLPWVYTLEGDVEDVSRQHIANRSGVTVHPAPWYVGVKRIPYFADQKAGVKTEIVTAMLDGSLAEGVPVALELTQVQWKSVRRAEGDGFYTWDSEREETSIGKWNITTGSAPVPFDIQLSSGGNFILTATGRGPDGAFAVTRTSFYALGDGYTAWARHDHNRIDLVPERRTWKPGETARIMIQSPWENATALLTTEREGIRSHQQFALTSTQQSVTVPIGEADIPNVYVSVLLVKGRTIVAGGGATPAAASDTSDPGKPSFRLGYVELQVEDTSKRLTVAVAGNKQEYRPANAATIDVNVKDHAGRGAASEVTLWAVDYGVLSLTAYRTPDILGSVYVQKALQVKNTDNRQRIISRRVLTPKGETEGGGGGAEAGAGTIRKDFRVLAFWLGSVVTDAAGHATVDVKLPESLSTYRIMAVAADRESRFGAGDSEVRINKPITLKPTWPRFLAVGDTARFGAVITSQLASGGIANVTIKSLDPSILEVGPATSSSLPIGANGSVEARFQAIGRAIGRARLQMSVNVGGETDAFEDVIPVQVLVSPETVAAYGEAADAKGAVETVRIPAGTVPGFGGLHVEMASTAMVGLGEGARYLVEYPYGCAEQQGSRALALVLAADLGDAFSLPGVAPSSMRPAVHKALGELRTYQCANGGFAYWPGACWSTSPYLTAYLLHVFKVASDLNYEVDAAMRQRAYTYLESQLGQPAPTNEGWWPSYTAWQAFAVKVLAEGGRNQDSNITRLYGYRDRMPVFALAYLHDAMLAKGETSSVRAVELRRRLTNAILPEGGSAHVEELSDPYLLWFWNSNVRSTAIVLSSLVRAGTADTLARPLVRWMMAARKSGRWGNTQENAVAMEALVGYYRKYESVVPDFSASARLGASEVARAEFRGRSTESAAKDVPMPRVLEAGPAGASMPLTFAREGNGTLYYTTRLRYAADALFQTGLDTGFSVERTYAPYLETGVRPAATTFKAGDLVRVTLTLRLPKERRFVAVIDPLPAGFEPVESWFATTARTLAQDQDQQDTGSENWNSWWARGGFDHVERHDDRIVLFATRLSEGRHTFSYIARATTAGEFRTAPAHAEEMYEPEVFGRTATAMIKVVGK